ncbi:MAG: hypothetical protein JSW41_05465 [Candidatus Aenigmatarchaeota archaeon]|nr:MAG: hypothetical protein JSW41_05465 [Candidatus Aenigmarchaeota archaeon]
MVLGKLKERRRRIKAERETRKFVSERLPKKTLRERATAQRRKAKEQAHTVRANIKRLSKGRIAPPGARVRVRKTLIKAVKKKRKRKRSVFDMPIGEGFFE